MWSKLVIRKKSFPTQTLNFVDITCQLHNILPTSAIINYGGVLRTRNELLRSESLTQRSDPTMTDRISTFSLKRFPLREEILVWFLVQKVSVKTGWHHTLQDDIILGYYINYINYYSICCCISIIARKEVKEEPDWPSSGHLSLSWSPLSLSLSLSLSLLSFPSQI